MQNAVKGLATYTAALLTGRYQELVGVPGVIRTHPENSWGYLRPDAVLLPELLGKAGYRTLHDSSSEGRRAEQVHFSPPAFDV